MVKIDAYSDMTLMDNDEDVDSEPDPRATGGGDDITGNSDDEENVKSDQQNEPQLPHYMPPIIWFYKDIGNATSADIKSRGIVEHMNVWGHLNIEPRLGQHFESKKKLKSSVKTWSIKHNREYNVYQSKKEHK